MSPAQLRPLSAAMFTISACLILFELLLTRLFGVILFAQFAHLALALAMLGISVGAILQHLRPALVPTIDDGLHRRLAQLMAVQGALTLVAVLAVLYFPVVEQFAEPPTSYGERSSVKNELMNTTWFAALLPFITAPFVVAGISFAGVFQRCKAHIGRLYGADLVGGAVGAVVFIPVLDVLAGPDVVWVILAATWGVAGWLWWVAGHRSEVAMAGAVAAMGVVLALVGSTGRDVLRVRAAAGFSEERVTFSRWTPLARLSISAFDDGSVYMLLDNTSASEIFVDTRRRDRLARLANRSMVWTLHEPPGKVAILAASAGPEVAVAQANGFEDIDAIDIAGEIFDIVADRFPDNPINPYLSPDVARVKSDGRAAILHAEEPYDVIQMVHANLWSSAGLVSNAWSPSLLETAEAFDTYLDKLTPDGTLSFGRGSATDAIARSAAEALRWRGVEEPWRHMYYVSGSSTVLLVKPRPFTKEERDRLVKATKNDFRRLRVVIDPMAELDAKSREIFEGNIMRDDRPYLDDWSRLTSTLSYGAKGTTSGQDGALAILYGSIVTQAGFVTAAGLLFLLVPYLLRGRTQVASAQGVGVVLVYVACLGYGYLALETVLIHELVLFVGHPTYAVTLVLLAMLLSSGVGSMISERFAARHGKATLQRILAAVVALGVVQAFVVPPVLHATALGAPLTVRMVLVFVALLPLGTVMGMPFPLAVRLLPERSATVVPWAWALNGWMSVVASLVTVLVSRLVGYSYAMGLALIAYALAFLVVPPLFRITGAGQEGRASAD